MFSFYFWLLGNISYLAPKEIYDEIKVSPISEELIRNFFIRSFEKLIYEDLVGYISLSRVNGYHFKIFGDYQSDLYRAAGSIKILKYFFLTEKNEIYSTSSTTLRSIELKNMNTFRFLLNHPIDERKEISKKKFLDENSVLFFRCIQWDNLKAAKYLIESGFKKEFFRYIGQIVENDRLDFLEYFISIGYKIEEDFCERYKCLESSKIYKFINIYRK